MLFRTFNITLTPKELGAVTRWVVFGFAIRKRLPGSASHFDRDGDGGIDCAEFLLHFFQLGFAEREKCRVEWIRSRKLRDVQNQRMFTESSVKEEIQLQEVSFTIEDAECALKKLTDAAGKFDKNRSGASSLPGEYTRSYEHPQEPR
jgi:hypothetical protein